MYLRTDVGQPRVFANTKEVDIQPPNPARAPSHVFFGLIQVKGVRAKACNWIPITAHLSRKQSSKFVVWSQTGMETWNKEVMGVNCH